MNIRLATLEDLPQVLSLIKNVVPVMNATGNYQWDDSYPNEAVFKEDIDQSQLWVAETDNVIAGVAAITTDQDEEYAEVGWDLSEQAIVIHRLAVNVEHQGRGIARALLLTAEKEAIKKGIKILRVDTNTKNTATQKLFPALGYTFAGEIDLHFRPNLRFFCYEKRLG